MKSTIHIFLTQFILSYLFFFICLLFLLYCSLSLCRNSQHSHTNTDTNTESKWINRTITITIITVENYQKPHWLCASVSAEFDSFLSFHTFWLLSSLCIIQFDRLQEIYAHTHRNIHIHATKHKILCSKSFLNKDHMSHNIHQAIEITMKMMALNSLK